MRRAGVAFVAKRCQRRVEHLRGIAVEGLADLGTIALAKIRQPAEETVEFGHTRLGPARPQLLDHWRRGAVVHVAHQAAGFLVDDRQRLRQLPLPAVAVGLARGGEVVDAIQPHPRPLADPRIEITGHGEVEHHEWPSFAAALGPHEKVERHNMVAGTGRAHHEISGHQFAYEVVERRRPRVESCREVARPGRSAIDDHDVPRARRPKIPQRLRGHLAGTHEQHPLVVEPLEHTAGKIGDGHARDRDPLTAQRRLRRHPLRRTERRLKHAGRERTGGLAVLGDGPRLLDLREDLRLAEHHAVEAGRHAKQVPHHRLVVLPREQGGQRGRIDSAAFSQE